MKSGRRIATLAVVATAAVLGVVSSSSLPGDKPDGDESRIQRGFQIAPVPLDLKHKNRALVGLGSYIVNAQGGCNDCHTNPSYKAGGDPHLGQPAVINAEHYLAGGQA